MARSGVTRGRVALVLFAVLVGLTVVNRRAALPPSNHVAPEESRSARALIYLAAQSIEQYRDSTGRYPLALDRLGLDHPGIQYQVRRQGYALMANLQGEPITYHSGDDLEPFRRAMEDVIQGVQP